MTLLNNQKLIGQDATVSVTTLGGPALQLGNAYPAINPKMVPTIPISTP